MSGMLYLEEALRLVNENTPKSRFFGPASEGDISKSAELIGLRFPPSYTSFLKTLGAGSFGSAEFYGIIANKVPGSSVPSMTWRTLDEREASGLPRELIPIMSSGYGPLFCLDSSNMLQDEEYPVILWSPSNNENNLPEKIADDFGKFFLDEIKKQL